MSAKLSRLSVVAVWLLLIHVVSAQEYGGIVSALNSYGEQLGLSDGYYWHQQHEKPHSKTPDTVCTAEQADDHDGGLENRTTSLLSSLFAGGGAQEALNPRRLLRVLPTVLANLVSFVLDNPFVSVVGLGSLATIVKTCLFWAYVQIAYRRNTTLEVSSEEQTYHWLVWWLHNKDWGVCRHVQGVLLRRNNARGHDADCSCYFCCDSSDDDESPEEPEFALVPNLSSYRFKFEGTWIRIKNNKKRDEKLDEEQSATAKLERSLRHKSLTLSARGNNPAIFARILAAARTAYCTKMDQGTSIYTSREGIWTNGIDQQRKRPLESVVLEDGVLDKIMGDIKQFISSSAWYINLGIPYRRGYLLYGPPGCGKTSIIAAIAGHLSYSVAVLSLSDPNMNDQRLSDLMMSLPTRCVVLLEDIDAAFNSRVNGTKIRDTLASSEKRTGNAVTFSGVLNALDGVGGGDARLMFMTTNYPERLDPALIRPGRVDVKHRIGFCTEYQVRTIFGRFFAEAPEQLLDDFIGRLKLKAVSDGMPEGLPEVTPASLQGFFLLHRFAPEGVLTDFDALFKSGERLQGEKCMQKDTEEDDDN